MPAQPHQEAEEIAPASVVVGGQEEDAAVEPEDAADDRYRTMLEGVLICQRHEKYDGRHQADGDQCQ
jgi:hypothetical protein